MDTQSPVLHLLCGKIASGKSTLARELAAKPATVLISEDEWLSCLYPEEMESVEDYIRYSGRLRAAMGPHIIAVLRAGVSVVLDFPANTVRLREWMLGLARAAGAKNCLHYLDVPNERCKARLRERNAAGTHAFAPSDADFDKLTRYFEAPESSEGLKIERHAAS